MLYNIIKENEEEKGFYMCKYCEYIGSKKYGEDMVDSYYSDKGATMAICDVCNSERKYLDISIPGEKDDYQVNSIDIYYCPICGRKF